MCNLHVAGVQEISGPEDNYTFFMEKGMLFITQVKAFAFLEITGEDGEVF